MKQKKNVQPVAEETQSIGKPLDLSAIDPKMLKMASKFGIPLEEIINWAQSVEQRLNVMQQEMPEQIQRSMEAAIESQRQKQIAAYQQAASQPQQQGGGGFGGMAQLLPQILQMAGGGGQDEELNKLTKAIMAANLDRIKSDASFTDAIKNAIVTRIAGKAAANIVDGTII